MTKKRKNEACPVCNNTEELADWILCDGCKKWFHDKCVGLTRAEAAEITKYYCPECAETYGESQKRRVSRRKRTAIDYVALDNGEFHAAKKQHIYTPIFENATTFDTGHIQEISGTQLTRKWAEQSGIKEPVVIRRENFSTIGMTVPPDLTVRRVAELVGEDTPLAVIDVPSQSNLPGWTLGKWRDYYETDYSKRDRIRNVISLEISDSELGKQIERPQFVRDMDLVSKVWDAHEEATYPKVTLYCLMSVRDSYTDFHIDFGGSSVFYHICKGAKTFLFIPPTESNLKKYEKWCNSSDQNTTFFANLTDVCYRVDLSQGDSMLIPSGWIHAVHTPEDSVVIGGNFLTPINMETQVRLAQIERNTKVPRKFQFPHFNRVMWYTARHYKNRIEANETVSYYERKGLGSLLGYLNDIVAQHDSVPKFIGDGKHFLSELEELCKSLEFKAEEDTLKNPDIRQRSPPTLKDEDPDSQELSAPLTEEDSSKDPDSRKRSPPLLMKEEVQLKKSKTE